jgi:hypothetical protein
MNVTPTYGLSSSAEVVLVETTIRIHHYRGIVVMPFSTTSALAQSSTVLAGMWTYRSFHNNPAPVADDPNTAPQKALALIFAEAVFTFEIPTSTTLKGAIDWPGGGLDLQGTIGTDAAGASPIVDIIGTGRHGTATASWEYDYRGQLAYQWPNGVNQVPAFLGTVIRAKPHNGAPAGYVASFIAVKRP